MDEQPNQNLSLTKRERRAFKKQRKENERKSEQRKSLAKKILSISLIVLIVGGIIFGFVWYAATRPNLPPITIEGHAETMPQAHISLVPMPDNMQRHMLEHADGGGKPGIIIQYNCQKYSCEPDLIQKLTDLAKQYPENVYLAPNNYDAKIILTKLNTIQSLDGFDEGAIKKFIGQ